MARLFARILHIDSGLYPIPSVNRSFNRYTNFGTQKKPSHNFPTHSSLNRHKVIRFPRKDDDENYHFTRMALRHAGYSDEVIEEIMRMPYQPSSMKKYDDANDTDVARLDEKERAENDRLSKISEKYAKRNG